MVLGEVKLPLLRVAVDFKAISLCGYMPQVVTCLKCKQQNKTGFFGISEGGIICSDCKSNGIGYSINEETMKFLHILRNIKLENLTNINYEEKTVEYVQHIMTEYIVFRTNREFKSVGLINSIK
jgi:DNA repair protein RecO (recombination protein O)